MTQGCGIGACDLARTVPIAPPIRAARRPPAEGLRLHCAMAMLAFVLFGMATGQRTAADSQTPSAFVRGVAAYQRGDWELSAVEFAEYLDQAPPSNSRRDAQFYLAEVQVQLGNFAEAHRHYADYLTRVANDPPAMVIRARFRLGEASFHLHEYDRAAQELQAFIARHPDDALAGRANDYLAKLPSAGSAAVERTEPSKRQVTDSLVDIQAAIRQGDHQRAIVLIDELLGSTAPIEAELRRQAAAIGFRQWLVLGNERRAIATYLQGLPPESLSADMELNHRREMASTLDSSGRARAAARERARCQQIDFGDSRRTEAPPSATTGSPQSHQDSPT